MSCDNALEVMKKFGHVTLIQSTILIRLDSTQHCFISQSWTYSFRRCWSASPWAVLVGPWAKFRKATLTFLKSLLLTVHMYQLGSHRWDFREILHWGHLLKYVVTIEVYLKSDKIFMKALIIVILLTASYLGQQYKTEQIFVIMGKLFIFVTRFSAKFMQAKLLNLYLC
jgi:hypothetical protein